jgi:malate dehydrogenase (quinone)
VATLLKIAATNFPLVRYLLQQGTQSMADRMRVMHIFYPNAKAEDWKLVDGGIRVQAIKKTDGEAGIVHFGTEVLTSADKSMSALLGASPGASVSVDIVLKVIKECFPHLIASPRMAEIVPTYGTDYRKPENAARFNELFTTARKQLKLL